MHSPSLPHASFKEIPTVGTQTRAISWPNPRFKGFTGSEEGKMYNMQMETDLSFKPPPKFFKLDTLIDQCKTTPFQSEKSVLYGQK